MRSEDSETGWSFPWACTQAGADWPRLVAEGRRSGM